MRRSGVGGQYLLLVQPLYVTCFFIFPGYHGGSKNQHKEVSDSHLSVGTDPGPYGEKAQTERWLARANYVRPTESMYGYHVH